MDPLRTEGAVRRGWRDARLAYPSFPFLVAEVVGTGLGGAAWGWLGGLVAFLVLVVVVFVGSVITAPVRQRNELRSNLTEAEGTNEWLRAACISLAGRIDKLLDDQEAEKPPTPDENHWSPTASIEMNIWELETSTKCHRFVQDLKAILAAIQERGWINKAEAERVLHDEAKNREGWRRVARQLERWADRVTVPEQRVGG